MYAYHKEHSGETVYRHYAALPKTENNAFIDLFLADREDMEERLDLALHLVLFSYACGDKLPQRFYGSLYYEIEASKKENRNGTI